MGQARILFPSILALTASLALAGCGDQAKLPSGASMGADPEIPAPTESLIPTINVAKATGWTNGGTPVAGSGLKVTAYADNLDHPRWLYVLPNGDVLVAETNAPPKPEDAKGIKGWVMKLAYRRAGSLTPSANRITLLRDTDGDGTPDQRSVFLDKLNSPFGMALIGNDFYVADSDALLRYPYKDGDTTITATAAKVTELPAGPINHHWTKSLVASADGKQLYVGVGSNSNAAENGIAAEKDRASIWEIDPSTGNHRIFASGTRNPVGLSIEPISKALWVSVNERDELGSDLVPDYMTRVQDGGFYGWPYSYWGQHVDTRVKDQRPDLVAKAIVPDYALGNHTASLGLAFSRDGNLPTQLTHGAFVGQHGSWNRKPPSGYKVIFVPFEGDKPAGAATDVLTGFLDKDGNALGRPVGVTLDKQGALLVADDVGNRVWRVSADKAGATAQRK